MPRLLHSHLRQGGIGPALPSAGGIPDGLSMADNEKTTHSAIFADSGAGNFDPWGPTLRHPPRARGHATGAHGTGK